MDFFPDLACSEVRLLSTASNCPSHLSPPRTRRSLGRRSLLPNNTAEDFSYSIMIMEVGKDNAGNHPGDGDGDGDLRGLRAYPKDIARSNVSAAARGGTAPGVAAPQKRPRHAGVSDKSSTPPADLSHASTSRNAAASCGRGADSPEAGAAGRATPLPDVGTAGCVPSRPSVVRAPHDAAPTSNGNEPPSPPPKTTAAAAVPPTAIVTAAAAGGGGGDTASKPAMNRASANNSSLQSYHFSCNKADLLPVNQGENKCMVSSTRKKRRKIGNTEHPLEYLASHVISLLPKKEIKCDKLDNPTWKKPTSNGDTKYVGYKEIIEQAFLDGFYEEHIVQSEPGRQYLDLVGMRDKPYAIFSEDLQQRRKHRSQNQETSSVSQVVGMSELSNIAPHDTAPAANGIKPPSPPTKTAAADVVTPTAAVAGVTPTVIFSAVTATDAAAALPPRSSAGGAPDIPATEVLLSEPPQRSTQTERMTPSRKNDAMLGKQPAQPRPLTHQEPQKAREVNNSLGELQHVEKLFCTVRSTQKLVTNKHAPKKGPA